MGLNWTEEELQRHLSNNPQLKVREWGSRPIKKKPTARKAEGFDSDAERRYYQTRITPAILAGVIVKCELHKSFELVPAIRYGGRKYKNRVYTLGFYLEYQDGSVEVVEVKGREVKKLQRDYPLRRQLFLHLYCIPNNWRFIEIHDDEI